MKKYVKNLMLCFAGCITLILVMYFCSSFINYELNPKNWSESARGFIGIFSGMFFLFAFVIAALLSAD